MYHCDDALILASGSPRRRDLLAQAGYRFEVVPAPVDERRLPGEAPDGYVARLAVAKAARVAAAQRDRIVIGADTVVVLDGEVFGKPADAAAAAAMLRRLSNRTHDVLTGVGIVQGARRQVAVEATRVTFTALDDRTIDRYVATGEPLDKAGAYGAQGIGSRFIARVDGSYTNVVGLPIAVVDRLLLSLNTGDTSRCRART